MLEEREQLFTCRVSTPLLADWEDRVSRWSLPAQFEAVMADFVNQITRHDAAPSARRATLRGVGLELWDVAPPLFRDLYWELVDAGTPPRTILIASRMHGFPWELLVPARTDLQRPAPLGVECAISCWPGGSSSPPRFVPLTNSYVIAPQYQGSQRLVSVDAEVDYVLNTFSGMRISPARLTTIDETLARGGASLIHFAGHSATGRSVTNPKACCLSPTKHCSIFRLRPWPAWSPLYDRAARSYS